MAGGADGIRCFDLTDSTGSSTTISYHEEPVTGLDCSSSYLASCSESGEVVLHEHPVTVDQVPVFKSSITRNTLSSRCVRFAPNGKKLAISSDDLTIKVVDVEDHLSCRLLTGHSKSIKSVSWSPDSRLLVSSGCDGTLQLWDLSNASRLEPDVGSIAIQTIKDIIPDLSPESLDSVEAVWHPSGKYFVVPARDHGLAVFRRDPSGIQWNRIKTIGQVTAESFKSHKKPVTASAFTKCGKYLATGCHAGMVIVWDTLNWEYIIDVELEKDEPITAAQWRPRSNVLTIANQQGQITTWKNVIPSDRPGPFFFTPEASSSARAESGFDLVDPEEDDLRKHDSFDADDWAIDDEDSEKHADRYRSRLGKPAGQSSSNRSKGHAINPHTQKPFQPGATQLDYSSDSDVNRGRRYMAFNLLGLVQVLEKDEENIVTIEFHDQGKYTGYNFADKFKFHLSSIGDLGVAFACRSSKPGNGASIIRYDPFESWATGGFGLRGSDRVGTDDGASWQYDLPLGENATCLACGGATSEDRESKLDGLIGSGAVVIGTDKGYVRMFTGSGVQTYIWNLGQEIIALACSPEFVFVVHRSPVTSSTQPLNYHLMDTSTLEVVQEGTIPLPSHQTVLTWIGFSKPHSIPACYDSSGVLSFLDKSRRPRQGRWTPVLDTSRLKSEAQWTRAHWPIGVSSTELSCILVKGGKTQPSFPTPLAHEIPLQMPALRLDHPVGQLEESYLRQSIIYKQQEDLADPEDYDLATELSHIQLELDKKLLKLLEMCCRAEPSPELQKGLDYVSKLESLNTLEASMKICKFFNLAGLNERVSKLHDAKKKGTLTMSEKRRSKYAHLEDYSVISDSRVSATRTSKKHGPKLFEQPFEQHSVNGSHAGGPLSRGNIFKEPLPERKIVEDQDWEDNPVVSADWGLTDQTMSDPTLEAPETLEPDNTLSSVKRLRLSDYHLGEHDTSQSKQSTNPFAKKSSRASSVFDPVPTTTLSSTNPFSSKKHTNQPGTVPKTGLFFDRLDEHNQLKRNGSSKNRQSTLFGLPPKEADNGKKGTKRKNEAGDGAKEKTLKTFLSKTSAITDPKPLMGVDTFSESLGTEAESQVSLSSIDFSQSLPPRIRSTLPPPDDPEHENNLLASTTEKTTDDPSLNVQTCVTKLEAFRAKQLN